MHFFLQIPNQNLNFQNMQISILSHWSDFIFSLNFFVRKKHTNIQLFWKPIPKFQSSFQLYLCFTFYMMILCSLAAEPLLLQKLKHLPHPAFDSPRSRIVFYFFNWIKINGLFSFTYINKQLKHTWPTIETHLA